MLVGRSAPRHETPSRSDPLTRYSSEAGWLVGRSAPRVLCTPSRSDSLTSYGSEGSSVSRTQALRSVSVGPNLHAAPAKGGSVSRPSSTQY